MPRHIPQPASTSGAPVPIPSPYNFVPLSGTVHLPPWGKNVSHDVPFSDAHCGWFEIEATATTPVYVRNGGAQVRNKEKAQQSGEELVRFSGESNEDYERRFAEWTDFFRLFPGGPYAIPGSSFKGMLRNVLEIATFGKMILADAGLGKNRSAIDEAIKMTSPRHRRNASFAPDRDGPDFAEALLGFVSGVDGLRGRVQFEPLVASGSPQSLPLVETVLGAPHRSHLAHYGEQEIADYASGEVADPNASIEKIRGWKRYVVESDSVNPAAHGIPNKPPCDRFGTQNRSVATWFHPLPAATVFRGRIWLHNVREIELGALLWCLEWGGRKSSRHNLGMGKPFGYGCMKVGICMDTLAHLRRLQGNGFQPLDLTTDPVSSARNAFVKHMEAVVKGWINSEQLKTLLAMADPGSTPPSELRYPTFAEFKGLQDRFPPLALLPFLPSAHPPGGATRATPGPRIAPSPLPSVSPNPAAGSSPTTPPPAFTPPAKGARVRCVVLAEISQRTQLPYLKVEGDPGETSRGSLVAPPPAPLVPGSLVCCVVKGDQPRSYAYKFERLV